MSCVYKNNLGEIQLGLPIGNGNASLTEALLTPDLFTHLGCSLGHREWKWDGISTKIKK
jgi:hypothetical protein